jgi:hypothetical protein
MRLSLALAPLLASLVVGCGAATGIPDDPLATDPEAPGTDAGARPSHDATVSAPIGDASQHDVQAVDATLDAIHVVTDAHRPDATSPPLDALADSPPTPDAPRDSPSPLDPDERVGGFGLAILGVTDHGLVIYGDRAGTCWAMPFAGGAPIAISPASLTTDAGIGPCTSGSELVVVSHDLVLMTNGAPVYAWTAALDAAVLLPVGIPHGNGPYSLIASASSDSQYALWTYATDLGPEPVTGAKADGSNPMTFFGRCSFDGSFAVCGANYLGESLFLNVSDAANGWSRVAFAPVAPGFAFDAVGANVLFSAAGGLTLAPLDGSPASIIDPAGGTPEYLAPDGSLALYASASQLEAVVLPGGVPYAVGALEAMSYLESVHLTTPIGPVAVFTDSVGATAVALAPGASAPSLPTRTCELASNSDDEDGFTSDGSFLLLLDRATNAFEVLALAGGAPPSVLSTTSSQGVRTLTDSRIVFLDGYLGEASAPYLGTTDLRLANVALGSASTLLASRVDSAFALSPDRSELAYTINHGTSADGLYVVAIPTGP